MNKRTFKKITIVVCISLLLIVSVTAIAIFNNGGEIPDTPKKFVDSLLTPAQIEAQYNGDKYEYESAKGELPTEITVKWFEANFLPKESSIKEFDKSVVKLRTEPIFDENHEQYWDVYLNTSYNQMLGFMRDFCKDKNLDFENRLVLSQNLNKEFYLSYMRVAFLDRKFDFYLVQLDTNKEDEVTFFVKEVT